MTLASSLHKNRMTRAMSCGFGHFEKSALGMALRFTSVSMMLGRIEFTRTPVPFKSWARQSMRARAAALDAAYADPPAVWSNAAFDAIFTIDPLFCMTMADAAALATA